MQQLHANNESENKKVKYLKPNDKEIMMKKLLFSFLVCIFNGLLIYPGVSIADPSFKEIQIFCPTINGNFPRLLLNFKDYIAGYGTELIDGIPSYPDIPYFVYTISSGDSIPDDLSSYYNSGTTYNSAQAIVYCMFASSRNFSPFIVAHQFTNGRGGVISNQSYDKISILMPIGVK